MPRQSEMTSKTRAELRSQAQSLNPVVMVGHEGITDGVVAALDSALTDHELVKVRFQDRKGELFELETEGFEARAICHELDHLDGRLYIDVMDRELTEEEIRGHIPEDDAQ